MRGKARRQQIMERLAAQTSPLSASKLAKALGVSRQIIVGDVALLRAAGHRVEATGRGYVLTGEAEGFVFQIPSQHTASPAELEKELLLIVALGGEVMDVIVEHPVYGELKGNLRLKTKKDVEQFLAVLEKEQAPLLSDLTDGVHLHTIRVREKKQADAIRTALQAAGFLYEAE